MKTSLTIDIDYSPSLIKDRHTNTTITVRVDTQLPKPIVFKVEVSGSMTEEQKEAITTGIFNAAISGMKELEIKIREPMVAMMMGLVR